MSGFFKIWDRLFLVERPSIGLSLFRIAVAITVGAHVIPTFFPLADNYLSTAFKIYNSSFFPIEIINWIQKSPDGLVVLIVWMFCVFWFFFLIGLWSQASCILMTATCYYFYALNSFHIGTLSWDILLVTLFLMCITPYHGDYFSVDCLLKKDEAAYRRSRPYFLQRLLQLQIAFNYFYTALYKVTAEGNWIKDNPIYYIMNYPSEGVTKFFLIRDFFADKPDLCYWVGVSIVIIEFLMIFLLYYHRTRVSAIYLGVFFHVVLILTLDVPAIFFFLFPAQLLLFINPQKIVDWIDQRRAINQSVKRSILIFDGQCQFCINSVKQLKTMDVFDSLEWVDLHTIKDFNLIHPSLNKDLALSQLHLLETNEQLYGGFEVIRRLSFSMPMLFVIIPVLYFPGMGVLGPIIYRLIAKNRYLFHFSKKCRNNACFK